MYDDFMSGYNFGNKPKSTGYVKFSETTQEMAEKDKQKRAGVYDTSKFIRMTGPNGEAGEIYANGKMYIILGPGKAKVRTFGSRPYAIKYMQQKGWNLA